MRESKYGFRCDKCGDLYEPKGPTGDQFFCCGQKMRRMEKCEWYHFIGSPVCDACGRPASEHLGWHELRPGLGPFGNDNERSHRGVTWEQWEIEHFPERRVVVV